MTGGPDGLEIVIPSGRNLVMAVFLGLWLAGWLAGELNAIAHLRRGVTSDPFLLLWLTGWTVAGIVVACVWLWVMVGRERVLLGASALRVRRDVLGFGRTRVYPLSKVRNLRVAAQPRRPGSHSLAFGLAGIIGGVIAFECEGRTIRFGASIDEAEAQRIVDRMRQRYAFSNAPTAP